MLLLLRWCGCGRHQVAAEEIGLCGVGGEPGAVQEETVYLVGEDELFVLDALLAEFAREARLFGRRGRCGHRRLE